jgi:hypothetical protein
MSWARRVQNPPPHVWLREMVGAATKGLGGG